MHVTFDSALCTIMQYSALAAGRFNNSSQWSEETESYETVLEKKCVFNKFKMYIFKFLFLIYGRENIILESNYQNGYFIDLQVLKSPEYKKSHF